MTDIHIPPEVVEAGARAACAGNKWDQPCATACVDCRDDATAAIRAALAAWPGLNHDSQAWRGYGGEVLILPLPETKKKTQPGAFDYWPAEEEGNWGDD